MSTHSIPENISVMKNTVLKTPRSQVIILITCSLVWALCAAGPIQSLYNPFQSYGHRRKLEQTTHNPSTVCFILRRSWEHLNLCVRFRIFSNQPTDYVGTTRMPIRGCRGRSLALRWGCIKYLSRFVSRCFCKYTWVSVEGKIGHLSFWRLWQF